MVEFLRKNLQDTEVNVSMNRPLDDISNKQLILAGASLELLRDLRERMQNIEQKIAELERKIPSTVLTEEKFTREIRDGDEIVERIAEEVRNAISRPIVAIKGQISIVEQKTMERILKILNDQGSLSSTELSKHVDLSRTRCSEYLKRMEELGLVTGKYMGKEKHYKTKS